MHQSWSGEICWRFSPRCSAGRVPSRPACCQCRQGLPRCRQGFLLGNHRARAVNLDKGQTPTNFGHSCWSLPGPCSWGFAQPSCLKALSAFGCQSSCFAGASVGHATCVCGRPWPCPEHYDPAPEHELPDAESLPGASFVQTNGSEQR